MSNYYECIEQAAHFALLVNQDEVDAGKCEGFGGLIGILSRLSVDFIEYHGAQAELIGVEPGEYWDSVDWYEASEDWFGERVAPAIYKGE